MQIFDFDPADHRDHYVEHGWVHIPQGISPGFMEELRSFVTRSLGDHHVEGTAIGGSKDQAVFEFPASVDYPGELFDAIAATCGLNRPTMTLSERHVKAYFDDTPVEQIPHKDRRSSQVSVGLSIDIPEESELLLYPHDQVSVNPYNISGALPNSLPTGERPEVIAKRAEEVVIDDQPGDVIAFRGSAIWHCRRRAAGAINLYLKMNDFNSDPLGEDPLTEPRREATLEAVQNGAELESLVPTLARRLDYISRMYVRDSWEEVPQAQVFDRTPVQLDQVELELLRAIDGERSGVELLDSLDAGRDEGLARIKRLAEVEVLDLIRSDSP